MLKQDKYVLEFRLDVICLSKGLEIDTFPLEIIRVEGIALLYERQPYFIGVGKPCVSVSYGVVTIAAIVSSKHWILFL
jgi:hypothetical protein